MDDGTRLYELFLVLFRSERELRRFVALVHPEATGLGRRSVEKESLARAAQELAQGLAGAGLADRRLFDELVRRDPGRRADIEDVAAFYGVPSTGVTSAPGSPGPAPTSPGTRGAAPTARPEPTVPPEPVVPPEFAAFARELRQELDTVEPPPDLAELAVSSPAHWPWAGASAVLGAFRPLTLHPLVPTPPGSTALGALAELVFPGLDGTWVLQDDVRARCLRRLWDDGALPAALAANVDAADARRDILRRLTEGTLPPPAELDSRALDDLDVVAGWLEPLDAAPRVDRSALHATVERRILIDPLRALVGQHFRGRTDELRQLGDHVGGRTAEPVLIVEGPGGSGKSSLIGKVLLDLELRAADGDVSSFVYLDFDKARHDPHSPRGLLEQIARQLQLLYATSVHAERLAGLESVYGDTDVELAAEVLGTARGALENDLIGLLAREVTRLAGRYGHAVPLILVLDTFEEVTVRGPGAVRDVWTLVGRLRAAVPATRVVVSGRSVVLPDHRPWPRRVLGDLDPEAADAVLARLGVAEPAVRGEIVRQFGGNPLTLRLAAEALARSRSADEAFGGLVGYAGALADVAREQVQGMLYSRILGHIDDPEVARVAHPGLAVRRVTVGVLREVLAEPCGFDPARAEDLFDRLRRDLTMFDREDVDTLRHRQDVRRLMLRTIYNEPRRARTVTEIHRRAIRHYAGRADPQSRAEHVYHRLMAGDDPRSLDPLWDPDLTGLLSPALDEPLPPPARTWLARRVGVDPDDDRRTWAQADWEADAAGQASSWLASQEPRRALEVLAGRSERLPASRLHALEITARLALDDVTGADDVLGRGLRSALDAGSQEAQLQLTEQAVLVRGRQRDVAGVVTASRAAARLADLLGRPRDAVTALVAAVEELRRLGADDVATEVAGRLAGRFARFDRDELRSDVRLVRRVLRAAGPLDPTVLRHAAVEVGDETGERDGVFFRDPFVVTRLLDRTTEGAGTAMTALADEVGLAEPGWGTQDLASRTVRSGRTGKALLLGLDYARDPAAARELVAENLVRPVDTP